MRKCEWCDRELGPNVRSDAVTCSKRCRQARHRFGRDASRRRRATHPIRLAYADPPYPGLARRYYAEHPDYAGEVDHAALLEQLRPFDGWALSTSSGALSVVLVLASRMQLDVRVAAWFRGPRIVPSRQPLQAWEPVVYCGGRHDLELGPRPDALVYQARPRLTDPNRVVGAKSAAFCYWMFDLLGARPGDELVDMFPGSGGVTRAWQTFTAREQPSHLEDGDDYEIPFG